MDKRKHKRSRRFLSALMVLAMLVSLMPAGAFAMDGQSSTPTDIVEQNPANEPGTGEEGNSGTDGTEGTDSTDGTEEGGEVTKPPTEPTTPTEPTEPAGDESDQNSLEAVYVSADGSDDDAGTAEKPFATLAKAVDAAADGATVYVMSDLTLDQCVRVINKSLTIDGQGHTITRGDIQTIADNARSFYNPAMFELNTWDGESTGLTLTFENIVLDDAGKHAGTEFAQQEIGEGHGDNTDNVQDAIVASYTTNTIVLGNGTKLLNYGGMAAVRVTGGAKLLMQDGSSIEDTTFERTDGHETIWGAVNAQSGVVEMEEGSVIQNLNGRALFLDSSVATVNGTIQNIKPLDSMRDADGGLAAYIWSDGTTTDIVSKMTLGPTGRIMNIEGNGYGEGDAIIVARNAGSTFEMQKGSEITGISHTCVLYPVNTSEKEPVTVNGRVADCDSSADGGYLFRGFGAHTVFDKDSVIENNKSSSTGVIYSTNGVRFTFRGKIINNTALRTIYLIDHSGAPCYATIEDGALISGNSSTAVYVNQNAHLTMTGGEISDNGTGVSLSGKDNQTFTMTGGKIINNRSGGISYSSMKPQTIVKVSGGLISGNGSNYQISASYGESNDQEAHLELSTGILQGNATISSTLGYLTLDADYADIQLGSAAQSVVDKFKALLSEQQPTWSVAGSKALWFKPSEESLHFTVNRSSSIDKGRGLYVAYMPLQADGTPAADAALSELKPLANTDTLDVTLNGLQPGTSYALMFVLSDEYTLKPDDITVYTGGDGTDSSETNGLPAFSMNDSIPSIKNITVNGQTTEYNTWGDEADAAFARIFDMFEVAYLDENGKEITDDKTPGVYTAKLSLRPDAEITDIAQLKINGNTVKIADGELTIRFVSDPEDAADEKLTTIVQAQPLTEEMETPDAITNGQAVAVIENIGGTGYFDPSFYTNGSENAELTDVSGVSLFFDELLPPGVGDNTGIDRAQALEDKADAYLGDSVKYPAYEMKYLDLVDKNNGNAWVASDSDITIYWPYPEGTSAETEFRVLHFRGLHREYGAEYTEESLQQQIEESVIEEVTVTNTKHGVSFTLPGNETEGSFSPFALVWAGSEPDPGPGPDPDPTPDPGPAPGPELERGDHYAYIVGYEDDTIRPKNNITRAEVATIFFRLLTDESREAYFTTDQDFTDVNDSAWYANTVATLSNAGILAGYPDGSFRPNDPITRAEFAAIATRFDDLAAADSTFTDIDGHWAEDAINAAYGAGWVGGYPDGTFRPNNNITRAEVMSLVNRVLDREVDEDGMLDDMLTWTDNEPGTWYYEAVQEATNSHDYEREDVDSLETWTQINEPIDWDKVEDDLLNN